MRYYIFDRESGQYLKFDQFDYASGAEFDWHSATSYASRRHAQRALDLNDSGELEIIGHETHYSDAQLATTKLACELHRTK